MPNSDCTLYAKGYKYPITVPVIAIDFGMRIIATEDMGRDNRIMYPRQVQQDTFSITAIFDMSSDRDWFNGWIGGYIDAASVPGLRTAIPMRVICMERDFDFKGIPVAGWSYGGAPVALGDVTWPTTIQFDGAAPTYGMVWAPQSSYYTAPTTTQPADQLFYPSQFYGTGQPGSGPPTDPYVATKGLPGPPLPSGVPKGGPFEARPSVQQVTHTSGAMRHHFTRSGRPPSAVSGSRNTTHGK
jgi:hypothetical protein